MDQQPGGLGRAIQVRRAELGLKRKEVAERALLSYPYLSELENGSKMPSAKALRQLAAALELSQSELLRRADHSPAHGASHDDAGSSRLTEASALSPNLSDGSGIRGDAIDPDQLGRLADVVAATVRAELSAWARTSLPALIREEVRRALDEEGREYR
ncbi:helix-turn-helix domain-containing protein [Micromonospora mangrovi]|uniref:Helix-turn-helix transcriptional regulator n=2 Tax=Micromonospora TaxID=1873 RepID=A0AAU8H820_9ACTN